MALDPNEYPVRELRGSDSVLDGVDDIEELVAAREREEAGKDRKSAHTAITRRIEQLEDEAEVADEAEAGGEIAVSDPSIHEAEVESEPEDEPPEEPDDDPLEDLYEPSAPDPSSDEPVIFDTMGAGGGVTGHDTIHRDDEGEPACGARVGAKGQPGPRSRFPADAEDCEGCWG